MPVYPSGSIFIPSDAQDGVQGNAVVIDGVGGGVLSQFASIYSASGDRLPSGVFAVTRETSAVDSTLVALNVYDATFTLVASVTAIAIPFWDAATSPVAANGTNFYVAVDAGPSLTDSPTVYRVSSTGVLFSTSWLLPANAHGAGVSLFVLGASWDDATLYYGTSVVPGVLHTLVLATGLAGPDVLTLGANEQFGQTFLVTIGGNLVMATTNLLSGVWTLRQFSAAGAPINTVTLGLAGAFEPPEVFRDVDPTMVWVRSFPDPTGNTSVFTKYVLATGAVSETFSVTNLDGGGLIPATCPNITLGGLGGAACAVGIPSPPPPTGSRA